MIKHSLWRADHGMGYLPTHDDYDRRPWVLDSWDTEHMHIQRVRLPADMTGLYLRSVKTIHRIRIESLIALELPHVL